MVCPRCGSSGVYSEPFSEGVAYFECDCSSPFFAEEPHSHRWLCYRRPVLTDNACWVCEMCGAEVVAPADSSGCAPKFLAVGVVARADGSPHPPGDRTPLPGPERSANSAPPAASQFPARNASWKEAA